MRNQDQIVNFQGQEIKLLENDQWGIVIDREVMYSNPSLAKVKEWVTDQKRKATRKKQMKVLVEEFGSIFLGEITSINEDRHRIWVIFRDEGGKLQRGSHYSGSLFAASKDNLLLAEQIKALHREIEILETKERELRDRLVPFEVSE